MHVHVHVYSMATSHTLHLTPYTLHLTPYTLHLTFYLLQTLTSEGYGDGYPITDAGKIIATFTAVRIVSLVSVVSLSKHSKHSKHSKYA